jgi:MFS family permease
MNVRQGLAYLGCAASVGIFNSFSTFSLTLWVAANFTSSYLVISVLGNGRSFVGAVASPLAGMWSDRTWLPWLGRRRPFILVGGLSAAALLAATPAISRVDLPLLSALPEGFARLIPLFVANFLWTIAFNTMDDIHKALLVDITPLGPKRNWLAALALAVEMFGQMAILVLGFLVWHSTLPDEAFLITAALIALGMVVTVVGVEEPRDLLADEPPALAAVSPQLTLRGLFRDYRGAAAYCLSMFAYGSGLNAVLPLVSVYVVDILGASVGEAQLLPGLLLLTTFVLALPMGALGNRIGKRRLISLGYTLMVLAAGGGLLITTVGQGIAVFVTAGAGVAAILALKMPLLGELVPPGQIGAASGILAAAGSLSAPVASVVGGALSDIYGPRAVFGVMMVMVLIALGLMPAVRPLVDVDGARATAGS